MAGGPCVRDSDCGAGGACLTSGGGFMGGYCIFGCPSGAAAGDPCAGDTGLCIPNGGQLICMRDCTPGTLGQCRTGYICLDVSTDGSIGICYPNCNVNPTAICGAYQCVSSTGECSGACTAGASTCSAGSSCNASTSRCECGPSTNCGAGYQCYPRSGARSAFCGCTSSAVCSSGRSCDTSTGTCI